MYVTCRYLPYRASGAFISMECQYVEQPENKEHTDSPSAADRVIEVVFGGEPADTENALESNVDTEEDNS